MTPHNVQAEQSVLGALLLDNGSIDRIPDLKTEHFYLIDHKMIFAEIKAQITAGKLADVVTVFVAIKERLNDGLSYLNSLSQNTPSAANIVRYADMVRDCALRRGLIAETSRLAEMAVEQSKSAGEILDIAQTSIAKLAETRVRKEPIRASDAMLAHVDVMENRMSRKVLGIPTGFDAVDSLFNGGINRGNLVILGARPSMGKTALALNVSACMASDYSVLFLSQEMANGELLDRAVSFLGKIPLGNVIRGDMTDQQWSQFTTANVKLKEKNLYIEDQGALTILDVRTKAMLTKRKHGLDVLVVDYLQLMQGDGDNRNAQIEEISRGLKALAKELSIVVIALSQLNRQAAARRPQMSDLRDSGAIEQDADIVMFIHRDEVNNPDTHMRGFADLIVCKNRQGRIDDVLLEYEGQYTLFSDTNRARPEPKASTSRRGISYDL